MAKTSETEPGRYGWARRRAAVLFAVACSGSLCGEDVRPTRGTHAPPADFNPGLPGGGIGASDLVIHEIYFPPNPPPLGVEVSFKPGQGPRMAGHLAELRDFVGEPFYAPLGTRLAASGLPPELRTKLSDYQAVRSRLMEELRDHFHGTRDADAETRMKMNAELAHRQAPRLVALEKAADELRQELYRTRRFGGDPYNWNDKRGWKLGRSTLRKRSREESSVLEFQVMRAAVYFQEGLSDGQRRLLREVAMELEDAVFRPGSPPVSEYGFIFFSPDTARVHIPSGLPAAAATRLEGYAREKSALKSELRETVYDVDREVFISQRERRLTRLAKEQQERIEDLEDLAEDIRRELVGVAGLERPEVPPVVPPQLEEMVREVERVQEQLHRDLAREVLAARANVARPASGEPADVAEYRDRLAAAVDEASKAFNQENHERVLDLAEQKEGIAQLINEHLAIEEAVSIRGSAETVVNAFMVRQRKMESVFEYHVAVLEPGFSPEQRRLLFGSAIRRLELPLPGGEPQPTTLPGTLLPIDELGK